MKSKSFKIILSFLLILSFAGLTHVSTYYYHYHILPDGDIVWHYHVYDKDGNTSEGYPTHTHDYEEIKLYKLLNSLARSILCVALFSLMILGVRETIEPCLVISIRIFNYKQYKGRSPPLSALSAN